MKSSLGIAGLVLGLVGLIVALAIRQRWARPVGAALIAIAVVAEIAAVQAHGGGKAAGGDGGGPTLIPIATATTASPTQTTRPTSSPTGTFVIPVHLLSQIHPGLTPIIKVGTVNREYVRLANTANHPFYLGGWRLSNGTVTFVFPAMTLVPGRSVAVRTGIGVTTPPIPPGTTTFLHWNLTSYVWPHPHGTVYLRDAHGKLIDTCTYTLGTNDTSAGC
jgi:hypothetical protein